MLQNVGYGNGYYPVYSYDRAQSPVQQVPVFGKTGPEEAEKKEEGLSKTTLSLVALVGIASVAYLQGSCSLGKV